MFKSIFERLFWTNILILLVVFLSVSAVLSVFINHYVTDRQYEMALKVSETIDYWTGYLQVENNNIRSRNFYRKTLESWGDFLGADITVSDLDGNVIDTTNDNISSIPAEYLSAVKNGETMRAMGHFGSSYTNKVFTVAIPVEYFGNRIGGMYINTLMPTLTKTVSDLLVWFLIASTISTLTAFALIYRQSTRISLSVNRIKDAALDIAAGNFNERIPVTGKDEISQLSSAFNFMADSLDKLEDMRSQFVSDISHELRTPMTSISGFVEGILDGTIPPEKEKDYLKIVLDESNRLKKLVTDMLEMSKMSSSEYKLNVSEFDFVELIRICIIGLEQKVTEKQLDLSVDFKSDSLAVCADRDAIQRVLINLIDNAVKFSYPNTNIDIKMWYDSKKAYFSVGNYGKGIAKEELPHIFDRFYKTDSSRTNRSSGAGLGLSFVKNIMLLHQQSVWVDSHEAKAGSNIKYTTFTISLALS